MDIILKNATFSLSTPTNITDMEAMWNVTTTTGNNYSSSLYDNWTTTPSARAAIDPNTTAYTDASTPGGPKPYEDAYQVAQFTTGCILMPIVCFFGLVFNVIILVVMNQKSMETSTNFYLSILALADILKLANDTLYFVTVLLMRLDPHQGNVLYGYLYPYAHFIFCLATSMSSWLTISVAAERYLLVCHATRARGVCTLQRAKLVCGLVCGTMSIIALPYAFRYRTITLYDNSTNTSFYDVETTAMWENDTFVAVFNWIENLLRSIIPIIILIVLNIQIIKALNQTRANKKMASRNRITIMLVSVIIVFILCLTPDAIMSIVGAGYHDEENYLVKAIREVTDMLLSINAAVNFLLYYGFNSIFRQHFLQIFCKKIATEKPEQDESQYRKLPHSPPLSKDNLLTNNERLTATPDREEGVDFVSTDTAETAGTTGTTSV